MTRTQSTGPRRRLYPPIRPYGSGFLRVSDLHEIYYEECGNPHGKPAVFLHGGPGGGLDPKMRRFFDPARYRIVLLDQRGCGKSRPHASLTENSTWDLVADLELVREHLGIERWMVFGGSWGATLGLAYAEAHRERVTELILRGVFLLRQREVDWLYQEGASRIFPDAWEPYRDAIPESERGDFLRAYAQRLLSEDPAVNLPAARAWSIWEGASSKLLPDPDFVATYGQDDTTLAFARIECHYFLNKGWLDEGQLLRDVHRLAGLPGTIVQGRYDMVCPIESAWALSRAWPEADLVIVPDAGHSATEPGISRALVAAADRFAG